MNLCSKRRVLCPGDSTLGLHPLLWVIGARKGGLELVCPNRVFAAGAAREPGGESRVNLWPG